MSDKLDKLDEVFFTKPVISRKAISQPIAYTDREELDSMRGPNADTYANLWTIPHGCGQDIALYSQEYVTALIQRAETAEQYSKARDAENQGLMLTVGRLRVERAELERRLQQPIKLPQAIDPADVFVSRVYDCAEVESAIRAAGFKADGK